MRDKSFKFKSLATPLSLLEIQIRSIHRRFSVAASHSFPDLPSRLIRLRYLHVYPRSFSAMIPKISGTLPHPGNSKSKYYARTRGNLQLEARVVRKQQVSLSRSPLGIQVLLHAASALTPFFNFYTVNGDRFFFLSSLHFVFSHVAIIC